MEFLLDGISMLSWKQIVMYGVGILLIWLAKQTGAPLHGGILPRDKEEV